MSLLRKVVRRSRHYGPTWRYLHNWEATRSYKDAGLSAEGERVVAELRENGIARSSVGALLGEGEIYSELQADVARLEREQAAEIDEERRLANEDREDTEKTFLRMLLGDEPELDRDSIYARFALDSPLLHIANAYLRMLTRLRYYNVWHTYVTQSAPRQSQLWHRDREDYQILKVFVCMTDVNEGAGPFTYAPGTHMLGNSRGEPESFVEGKVARTTDAQMAAIVPEDRWVVATGDVGTILFADTRGFHKGGLARERDRLLYTCMFTSPASQSREWFQRSRPVAEPDDPVKAWALKPRTK